MSLNGSRRSGKGSPEQVEEGHHRQAQKEPEERTGRQHARHVEIRELAALPCGSPAYSVLFLLMAYRKVDLTSTSGTSPICAFRKVVSPHTILRIEGPLMRRIQV